MKVIYADEALESLAEIWDWNARNYGAAHAERYLEFLRQHTESLGASPRRSRAVPGHPTRRYLTIRRRTKGHGHVAVFELRSECLHVLDYFHTSQDWLNRLPD